MEIVTAAPVSIAHFHAVPPLCACSSAYVPVSSCAARPDCVTAHVVDKVLTLQALGRGASVFLTQIRSKAPDAPPVETHIVVHPQTEESSSRGWDVVGFPLSPQEVSSQGQGITGCLLIKSPGPALPFRPTHTLLRGCCRLQVISSDPLGFSHCQSTLPDCPCSGCTEAETPGSPTPLLWFCSQEEAAARPSAPHQPCKPQQPPSFRGQIP